MNQDGHTNALRKKLQEHVDKHKLSLYNVQKRSGIHRYVISEFLKGKGLHYESGMAIRVYLRNESFMENKQVVDREG
jgi:hypothetical protein